MSHITMTEAEKAAHRDRFRAQRAANNSSLGRTESDAGDDLDGLRVKELNVAEIWARWNNNAGGAIQRVTPSSAE